MPQNDRRVAVVPKCDSVVRWLVFSAQYIPHHRKTLR
jgi:hypothetical protein